MVPHFESGTIFATIYQKPYQQGRLAVSTLVEHLTHNTPLENIQLDPTIVLRSTMRLFREVNRPQISPEQQVATSR
jgi:ABC-type sugar transport system substrate-binding protein